MRTYCALLLILLTGFAKAQEKKELEAFPSDTEVRVLTDVPPADILPTVEADKVVVEKQDVVPPAPKEQPKEKPKPAEKTRKEKTPTKEKPAISPKLIAMMERAIARNKARSEDASLDENRKAYYYGAYQMLKAVLREVRQEEKLTLPSLIDQAKDQESLTIKRPDGTRYLLTIRRLE